MILLVAFRTFGVDSPQKPRILRCQEIPRGQLNLPNRYSRYMATGTVLCAVSISLFKTCGIST
jgi:hypothetical protein